MDDVSVRRYRGDTESDLMSERSDFRVKKGAEFLIKFFKADV